jgi:hypothetical protein
MEGQSLVEARFYVVRGERVRRFESLRWIVEVG